MNGLHIPILDSLEQILLTSTEMDKSIRWEKYMEKGEAREENSLQHSYKASLLAIMVLDNEREYSSEPFDPYVVLRAVILHDLGEIAEGDTVYIDKTEEGEKSEYDFFRNLIIKLPEYLRQQLVEAYDLQNARKQGFSDIADKLRKTHLIEAKLFDVIERLGYVIFAYREYRREGRTKILVQVLRHQQPSLKKLAQEFPGFRKTFYTTETEKAFDDFLEKYKGQFIEQKGE